MIFAIYLSSFYFNLASQFFNVYSSHAMLPPPLYEFHAWCHHSKGHVIMFTSGISSENMLDLSIKNLHFVFLRFSTFPPLVNKTTALDAIFNMKEKHTRMIIIQIQYKFSLAVCRIHRLSRQSLRYKDKHIIISWDSSH